MVRAGSPMRMRVCSDEPLSWTSSGAVADETLTGASGCRPGTSRKIPWWAVGPKSQSIASTMRASPSPPISAPTHMAVIRSPSPSAAPTAAAPPTSSTATASTIASMRRRAPVRMAGR